MTPDAPNQKILVVDDNLQNRKVAEAHLKATGYAVVLAESGERAVEVFLAEAPDLVLLDILMPGIDGFETCRRLREARGGAETPIVFLTAYNDLGTHQRAMESGAEDYLTKPINRTELLLRVRSLLRIRRLGRELRRNHDLILEQRDALLRAREQKDQLTGMIVHDLKSPLTAILSNVEFALESLPSAPEIGGALQDSIDAARAMHRMTIDLLDISRSEDGALAPNLAEFDLAEVVGDVERALARRAQLLKVRLQSAFQLSRTAVRADRELLRRVLENLLDNCLKYAPCGGTVRIEVRRTGLDSLELRVRDEGPGVPEEYRERIFEKYVRVAAGGEALARTSHGLGLVFCRLAIEAHGGRIWVEANEPKGSCFCVSLPAGRALTTSDRESA